MRDALAPRRFVVLVNPVAGRADAERRAAELVERLRAAGAEAHTHRTQNQAEARARARRAAGPDTVVVAAGGDGLVGAVAGPVAERDGVLGVLPAGRGNDFARALRVPQDLDGLARVLLHGADRRVDVLQTAGRVVVGSVATGIDAAADARVHARRRARVPAQASYRVAALGSLVAFRPAVYAVTLDDATPLRVSAYTVVVANIPTYGAGLRVAPDAVVDDGQLDVVLIGAMPRWRFPGLLADMRTGAHVGRPDVTVLRGRAVTVAADRPLAARGDGEPLTRLPVAVTVLPTALRVRAPASPHAALPGPDRPAGQGGDAPAL